MIRSYIIPCPSNGDIISRILFAYKNKTLLSHLHYYGVQGRATPFPSRSGIMLVRHSVPKVYGLLCGTVSVNYHTNSKKIKQKKKKHPLK